MVKHQLSRYGRWVVVLVMLAIVAALSASWILINQRLRTPLDNSYVVRAEFTASSGIVPGTGQRVQVSGVRVGTISRAVLRDGRALVSMAIDPDLLPAVHADASAALVPNSPLQDLVVELDPGSAQTPRLGEGSVIPVARTTPPASLDSISKALDGDTRRYFDLLLQGADEGTRGRAEDLRKLLKTMGPTGAQLRRVSGALASRRHEIARLTHNLALLGSATASHDSQLVRAVRAGATVLNAVSEPNEELRTALRELPGTLRDADHGLGSMRRLADELGPTSRALLPAARHSPAALRATSSLAQVATPVLRDRLVPLTEHMQPVLANLDPATRDVRAVTPALTSAFKVLNYTVDEVAYNPAGAQEGYLFWLAWFLHNTNSFVSAQDANGAVWRGFAEFNCGLIPPQVAGPLFGSFLHC